ncbi:hypothetical protein LTR53_009657 [Teratosphaeriaceae sp. CCFEE 6253]|nr:hypothetical protein LTR53_009657 [Teratosphaeriaceae sp. CCFEE 6253]
MRLLNVQTLGFTQFHRKVPRYIAASHRWKAGSEAMIGDIQNRRNTDKSGYTKVTGFARYIREHIREVEWLWIDTCCVNQDSLVEVDEAVNSMFDWYSRAELCLAYLTDVANASDEHEFGRSEWFRRGWTLQELLAPKLVVFLSSGWEVIGHKGGRGRTLRSTDAICIEGPPMERQVAATTKIPECVLHDYAQSERYTTKERLAWMAGRDTTRIEDMYYSMLGLFRIRLTLHYGEGLESARKRLLEEITKHTQQGHHRPETPPRPLSTVPFPRDPDFIHRGSLMDEIQQKLSVPAARVALVGLGGVGKSQLAIEHAHRVREASPSKWVLWTHASSSARFELSVRDALDQLKVPGREDPSANALKLFRSWLRDARNGEWLLILDNVDDARFLLEPPSAGEQGESNNPRRPTEERCLDYLPATSHGSILVTSRSSDAALSIVERKNIVDVQPMDVEHAVELVEKKLEGQCSRRGATELAQALDCLPLALAQAAAYITRRAPRCSVKQYLKKLHETDKSKASLLDLDAGDLRRDREASNSIMLTWQISFEHLREARSSAADLLSLMSLFDRQSIPEELLRARGTHEHDRDPYGGSTTSGSHPNTSSPNELASLDDADGETADAGVEEFEEDIAMLRSYSLISTTAGGATFEMHALVQLATQRWLKSHGRLERWQCRFIDRLDDAFPSGEYENWAKCQPLFPHAMVALGLNLADREAILWQASLLYKSGWYAELKGAFGDAGRMMVRSFENLSATLGEEHPSTFMIVNCLAVIYHDQGRYDKAAEIGERALLTVRRVLGEEHPLTLETQSILAETYSDQGHLDKAVELNERVLSIRTRVLGQEHIDTLISTANLAKGYSRQGRSAEAAKFQEHVLSKARGFLGEKHPFTLRSMGNLAVTYREQCKVNEAAELGERTVAIHKALLGEEHPETLMSLSNLAMYYHGQGNLIEAAELGWRVTSMRKRMLGKEHPDTLTSMGILAAIRLTQGRYNEAAELGKRVLLARTRVLGQEHPFTLTSMEDLSHALRDLNRPQSAMDLMSSCAAMSSKILGASHPDTINRCRWLGIWEEQLATGRDGACASQEPKGQGKATTPGPGDSDHEPCKE